MSVMPDHRHCKCGRAIDPRAKACPQCFVEAVKVELERLQEEREVQRNGKPIFDPHEVKAVNEGLSISGTKAVIHLTDEPVPRTMNEPASRAKTLCGRWLVLRSMDVVESQDRPCRTCESAAQRKVSA